MSKRLEEVMRLVNGAGKQDRQEEVRTEAASSADASERMQEIRKYTSRLPAVYAKARFDGAIKNQQEQELNIYRGFTSNIIIKILYKIYIKMAWR